MSRWWLAAVWLAAVPCAAGHPPAAKTKGPAPETVWKKLEEGNRRFVQGTLKVRPLAFRRKELVNGQAPHAMVLSCSDSRTPPELVFDQGLGELFVVRSAGHALDPVALGSLEYAAEHLHAGVLVVMGHRKCGAVAAAVSGEKMPTPNLEAIVRRIAGSVPTEDLPAAARARLAEENNVRDAMQSLLLESPLLREKIAAGELLVVPALYNLDTGRVERLP